MVLRTYYFTYRLSRHRLVRGLSVFAAGQHKLVVEKGPWEMNVPTI